MPRRAFQTFTLPDAFWQAPATAEAVTARDIGQLFRLVQKTTSATQTQIGVATGLSQAQVSEIMGGERRVNTVDVLVRIADGLGMPDTVSSALFLGRHPIRDRRSAPVSTNVAAGKIDHDLGLSGQWWAAWQTWKERQTRIDIHPLEAHQRGDLLQLDADRAVPLEEGSYRWRGELRLWDNEALMGWYRSTDAAVRSKGTIYFTLHPHGTHAWGRWVGMSYDGPVISGWGALARTKEHVRQVISNLIESEDS